MWCLAILLQLCVCSVQFADSIGLPTDEGLFGFKPFSEVWVGRLAMIGFLTSVVQEFLTGVLTYCRVIV